MKKNDLKRFMDNIIRELEKEQRYSSAHVYRSTGNVFCTFIETKGLSNRKLSAELLKEFETFLLNRQLSWNTISTYMRMLRATYNRAVERGVAKYIPKLFKGVYTGVQSKTKRALSPEVMAKLMDEKNMRNYPVSRWFTLMFLLRGMPFVDLAHLRKCDFNGRAITYHRHKTRKELTVSIPDEAMNIILQNMDKTSSPYLFPILHETVNGEEEYKKYQSELRKFNYRLNILSKEMGNGVKLSSYTPRHTWATTAYYQKMGVGVICNALGHSSVKVTESYLKPFDNEALNKANLEVISYIKSYSGSSITS